MAKQVTALVKLQCVGGQATPAPPVGPALGAHGVNIGQFVSQFNDRTKDMKGIAIPVVITVFSDRSFTFITKSPPAAEVPPAAPGPTDPTKSRKGQRPGDAPRRGKKLRNHLKNQEQKIAKSGPVPVKQAVGLLTAMKRAKFDETVEIHMALGIDT